MLSRISVLVFLLCFSMLCRAQQGVVINEILINGPGPCDGACVPNTEEWVELYNTTCSPADISCFRLTDGDFAVTIPQGTVIPALGFYLIGSSNSPIGTATLDLDIGNCGCVSNAPGGQTGIFTNAGEQLLLTSPTGVIADAVIWGGGQGTPTTILANRPSSCFSASVSLPATGNSQYEDIGSGGANGCTKARQHDGSPVWEERCNNGITPGRANGTPVQHFTVAANASMCAGGSVSLSTSGGTATWADPSGTLSCTSCNNPVASPAITTTYSVTLTNGPCTQTFEVTVTVRGAPVISGPAVLEACPGSTIALPYSVTDATTFLWYGGSGTFGSPTQIGSSYLLGTQDTGTFPVYAFASGPCGTTTDTFLIKVLEPLGVSAGPAIDVCLSGEAQLQASVAGNYSTFQWSGGSGNFADANALSTTYAPAPPDAPQVTLTATATDACGSYSGQVQVNVLPAPLVLAGPDVVACEGAVVSLSAIVESNSGLQWSGGSGSFTNPQLPETSYLLAPQDTGRFVLTLTAQTDRCGPAHDELVIWVTDSVRVSPGIVHAPQYPFIGEEVRFQALHQSRLASQIWDFGDTNSSTESQPRHRYQAEGVYEVMLEAINLFGCPVETRTLVEVITPVTVPNIFTPNADGLNDRLAFSIPKVTGLQVRVFNRWGRQVFETTDPDNFWDGAGQPDGIYFLQVQAEYAGGRKLEIKQAVTLVR